jgi:hypothetical protein
MRQYDADQPGTVVEAIRIMATRLTALTTNGPHFSVKLLVVNAVRHVLKRTHARMRIAGRMRANCSMTAKVVFLGFLQ